MAEMELRAAPLRADAGLWHHLRQLPALLRLVRSLGALSAIQTGTERGRTRLYFYALQNAVLLLSLGRAQRVLAHYRNALGLRDAELVPLPLLTARIEATGGTRLLDAASQAAVDAVPDDASAAFVQGLCREQAGQPFAFTPPANTDERKLTLAAGWLRAGDAALASGDSDQAARCFQAAFAADPAFNKARSRYADMVRRHDPLVAAQHYGEMLDHAPLIAYGRCTVGNIMSGRINAETYGGFVISFETRFDAYVAQPAFLGTAALTDIRSLLRWRNRLLGLLVMRVHVARRLHEMPIAPPAEADGIAAPSRVFVAAPPRLPIRARLRQAIGRRLVPALRFALTGDTEIAVRRQIDEIHRIWLHRSDDARDLPTGRGNGTDPAHA
jgi:tetratricopeptide (TPR) repeat protein